MISKKVKRYLKDAGISPSKIDKLNSNTRLFHDLDIYGDIAEGFIEELELKYEVDISKFNFDDYFPEEFSGDSTLGIHLLTFIPFLRKRYNNKNKKYFKPFTLRMIDSAIENKYL